jgi:hypothetical protein
MTWMKVDDGFYDHPKVAELPNAAVGLWVKAGSWCSKHLTDGVIPASRVKALKGTSSQVRALIECGLWSEVSADRAQSGTKSYAFRSWGDYQPTREQKEKERADAAERQREYRERKRQEQGKRENVTRDSHVTPSRDSHESNGGVSQRPDPTRPDPTPSTYVEGTHAHSAGAECAAADDEPTTPKRKSYPDAFERFWSAYPKRIAKKRAHEKWAAAVRAGADPDTIVTSATAYSRLCTVEARPDSKIKYPEGWLSAGRYDDDYPALIAAAEAQPRLQTGRPGTGHIAGGRPDDWDHPNTAEPPRYVDAEVLSYEELE